MTSIAGLGLTSALLAAPRPEPPAPDGMVLMHAEEVEAFSHTVTVQFRSFARIERSRRLVRGGVRIGAGALLMGVGLTNFLLTRGTGAQGAGMGVLGAGAVSVAGGIFGVAVRGPAETFVRSEAFDHGSLEGWSMEMFDRIRADTVAKAGKARKRRLAVGSLQVILGTAGAITTGTLLGLQLRRAEPNAVWVGSLATGLATSTAVVVGGVVSLAVPTIVELVAHSLHR